MLKGSTKGVVVSSLAAAMVAAGSTFMIPVFRGQIVEAFHVDPPVTRRIPYKYQQSHHQQQVPLHSLIPSGPIVSSIAPVQRGGKTRSNTILSMATGSGGENVENSSTINVPLISQNLANQALIGFQIWTGGSGLAILTEQSHFGIGALILGIAGLVPMLALSRAIETSESPFVSGLNLSTNMAVLRLFGPTPQPIPAFFLSFLMAAVTGVVEETIFRGQSLPAFADTYGNGDVLTGALLSSLLFAVLHTNPLGLFKGKEAFIDNFALLILQIINGGIFAFLYLFTGNLAVPIITHTLYDLYTFYKTHLVDVAGQMEYAEEESLMPICSSNKIEEKWVSKYGESWLKSAKQAFYLMDTNRDGELSRKELRIALYTYGINLSKVESEKVKEAVDTDGSGLIDFDEYLEFIGPTSSRYKAVRNTLLGPT